MTTLSMTTLDYSITEPVLRSPVEEWQPHAKQSESTTEWWYLTAVVHDTGGERLFPGLVSLPLQRRGARFDVLGLPTEVAVEQLRLPELGRNCIASGCL